MLRNERSHCLFGIILLAVGLSVVDASGQTSSPTPSPTPTQPSLEREFFKNILLDQKAIWTAPFHLEKADAKWLVPSSIGLMALVTTDRITGDEISELDDRAKGSKIASYPGSIYGAAAVTSGFYLFGRIKNDERARETGILAAEASVDSAILVGALKGITQRGRPESGIDRSEFFDGGSSFPSGHSIEAWSMAAIVADEYHDHRLVQVAAYGIASGVSLARFTGSNHYLSDVLVGSALGFGVGQYVYHAHHRKIPDSVDVESGVGQSHWPEIVPQYNRHERQYGVALTWNF